MNSFRSSKKTGSSSILPSPFYSKTLTEEQKLLLKQGWPIHSFDQPVEVTSGLWLSGVAFTSDLPLWCHENGFTHVLNASGSYAQEMFYCTNPSDYDFEYMELDIEDTVGYALEPYLPHAYNFIDNGLNNKGKILVHCIWGQSRSVSCLVYFMMMKWGIKYSQAIRIIRKAKPEAKPNTGFTAQLCRLQFGLRQHNNP